MPDPIYLVDPATKRPISIEPVSFASLNVRERQDLEAWVLNHPDILGEPLLVVTDEFDRFDRSNRRLDVLALDRDGTLVIVELKLDVAGSLADQQAIRYAAFCSTMTMAEAIREHAQFHACTEDEATARFRDFLGSDELPELGNRPRIILAAGSMDDQELTSCVLWLRGFGVDITCVELIPYRLPDSAQVLLVPRVIIPLPEARDFLISVERKEVVKTQDAKERSAYSQFWGMVAEEYNALGPTLRASRLPRSHFMQLRVGGKPIHYEWLLQKSKSQISVAIHFESSEGSDNIAWLSQIQAIADRVRAGVDEPFHAERWGRKWASAGFAVSFVGSPDPDTARRCAILMQLLVDRTYPLVKHLADERTA